MKKAMKFDNNAEEARMSRNISQEELANMMNVSIQTIKSIEKGKYKPSKALAITIASSLNREVIDIFPYLEA